jgi:hypothetical protein
MTEITLTDDQARAIAKATGQVVLRDAAGKIVATIPPRVSDDEWEIVAESKRRLASNERRYTTAEVLARLDSLD